MNTKTFFTVIGVILLLLIITIGSMLTCSRQEAKTKALERSYAASQAVVKYYRLKNGNIAATHPVETYTVQQIKDGIVSDVLAEIKKLDLKPKNITNYSSTVLESEKHITTLVRDSTIRDTVSCEVFSYTDNYTNIFGVSYNDIQEVTIQSVDTIIQVVHKKRKYPWLWIFSPKYLEQVVTWKNPSNKIVYERFIEVK
jgi:hypothetical protein